MAKYPRIQLDWKPLMDYPLDESGLTLGSYLKAKDVQPSDDELLRIYKDCLSRQDSIYTHYRIMDINGDGVKDLLRSGDGERYWDIVTYRYGNLQLLPTMDFYLCENNVMEQIELFNKEEGVEIEGTSFSRCNGFNREDAGLCCLQQSDCLLAVRLLSAPPCPKPTPRRFSPNIPASIRECSPFPSC